MRLIATDCDRLLIAQHAAIIRRNKSGLSPRDYARDFSTHDLLKLEELRQAFRLAYDAVLVVPYYGQSEHLPALGPPRVEDLKQEFVSKSIEETDVDFASLLAESASLVQTSVRGWLARREVQRIKLDRIVESRMNRLGCGFLSKLAVRAGGILPTRFRDRLFKRRSSAPAEIVNALFSPRNLTKSIREPAPPTTHTGAASAARRVIAIRPARPRALHATRRVSPLHSADPGRHGSRTARIPDGTDPGRH